MRRPFLVCGITLVSSALAGCRESAPTGPETFTIPVYVKGTASQNFGTHLTGDEEVPPVEGKGQGQAVLNLSEDGSTLHYKVITSQVSGITQSHIHIGAKGTNGPVVVFLFGFVAAPGVENNGILAEGDITAANLIARPAISFRATMPELVAKLRDGGAYVNVHTVAHPGGEVRGQVEEHGKTN